MNDWQTTVLGIVTVLAFAFARAAWKLARHNAVLIARLDDIMSKIHEARFSKIEERVASLESEKP